MYRLIVAFICYVLAAPAQDNDLVLKAMRDELERSKQLRVASTDPPYYTEYSVEDADTLVINASLGGLLNLSRSTVRLPLVRLRMGTPAFDNTDHVFSDRYSGTRYDENRLPLDNNYDAIRRTFWLATDRAFKGAQEAIGRKRAALKNINLTDQIPDFAPAPAVQSIQPIKRTPVDEAAWKARIVKLSSIFAAYPQVISSGLEFQSIQSTNYLVNTEGTTLRTPERMVYLRVRALAQAPDGATIRNADVFQSTELSNFPQDPELRRGITAVAEQITNLAKAPVGEAYDGPVLFEPQAAAQLFGQVLGDNLKLTRKPISEGNRPAPYLPSELENKMGSRILPDWMDIVDDPTQSDWQGQALFGHYDYDVEGVAPKPVRLVEKGVLKTFLLTRTPVSKNFPGTNGRARLHGPYGTDAAGFGNLFIRASQTVPAAELKRKLIEMVQQRNKPYGMLVRKLDYPSGMSVEELRRATAGMAQSGGGTRPVALPVLVYRVYPDGREELVRGLRFRGVSTRSLRDISAATDETFVFSLLDSTAPFALMGGGSYVVSASVIAPGVLFEELEFEPVQEDLPKLPVVPPPTIGQ